MVKTAPQQNSAEAQQDRMLAIAKGREAVALMGILRPYIDGRVHILVHQMAAAYRSGMASHDVLLGLTAQVSCMMDLLSDLNSRARKGDIATAKEMENAQDAPAA